jgi:hypothetical protein
LLADNLSYDQSTIEYESIEKAIDSSSTTIEPDPFIEYSYCPSQHDTSASSKEASPRQVQQHFN